MTIASTVLRDVRRSEPNVFVEWYIRKAYAAYIEGREWSVVPMLRVDGVSTMLLTSTTDALRILLAVARIDERRKK